MRLAAKRTQLVIQRGRLAPDLFRYPEDSGYSGTVIEGLGLRLIVEPRSFCLWKEDISPERLRDHAVRSLGKVAAIVLWSRRPGSAWLYQRLARLIDRVRYGRHGLYHHLF